MTFDQIMNEITSGLTGNPQEDVKYLMDQGQKYKNDEFSIEISRAIGRIIYEIIPEEMKNEFEKIIDNNNLGVEKTLEEADFQMYRKDFKKALKIIEGLIKRIEELCWYKDDNVSEYHSFNNFFEEIIYKEKYKPTKEIRNIPENYSAVYFKYGVILFELKNYDKAKLALEIANQYNPINTDILFELSEIHKMNKNWVEYLDINHKCLEIIYSNQALARCYRNFGYYFIEQSNYDMAIILYYLSINFDQDNKNAQSQLLYISEKTGEKIKFPNHDEVLKSLKKYKINLGANEMILFISLGIAQEAQKHGNIDMAIHFLKIFYDLTGDENVKLHIEELEKANGT